MQPEPTEPSIRITTQNNTIEPTTSSQYGFPSEHLPSADHRDPPGEERIGSASPTSATNSAESPSGEGSESQEQIRRLSRNYGSTNRPKPSFQRISEYEKALSPSPSRKHSEGLAFKIIKKKGSNSDGPRLDEFPNGTVS